MPGEVCPEKLPPPDMSNLGFLNTMPINGSDEILFPLDLCHCWGGENAIDGLKSDVNTPQDFARCGFHTKLLFFVK